MSSPTAPCPLGCHCQANVALRGPDFSLWRCAACALVRTDPPPDESALVERYDSADYLRLAETEDRLRRRCEDRLAVIAPFLPQGKLLDVGAGGGTFLAVAKEAGYAVRGVDLSPRWAEYAASIHGVEVAVGSILRMELPEAHYQAITLWHVLEHFSDPLLVLGRLRSALAVDGRLAVEVPNYGAPTNRLKTWWLLRTKRTGRPWRHLNPTEHCWQFELPTLATVLDRAGFRPVLLRTMSGDSNTGGGPLSARLLQARDWGNRLLCVAEAK